MENCLYTMRSRTHTCSASININSWIFTVFCMAGIFPFGKSRPFRIIAWSTYNVNRIITCATIATKRCLCIFVRAFRKLLQYHHYFKWNYSINLCALSKHCLHNIYLPYIAKNDQWYEQGKQWYTEIRRQGFHLTYFAGERTCNFLSHLKWKQFRIHIVLMCSLKKSVKLFTLEATFLKYVNLNLSF